MEDDLQAKQAIDVHKAYRVIERVLSSGHDSVGISISGCSYVLRTLSSSEEDEVRSRSCFSELSAHRLAWSLAYSVRVVGGYDCIRSRSESLLQELHAHLLSLPSVAFNKLFETLAHLVHRVDEASSLFAGYLHTPQSRLMWESFRSSGGKWGVSDPSAGTNILREVWARGNRILDAEERDRRGWDQVMFLASAHNPKGAKDSSTRLKSGRELIDEERKELALYGSMANRDLILNIVRGKHEQWSSDLSTREDIIGELDRQMRGEKDKHDLFVEEYFRKCVADYEAGKAAEEAAREEVRRKIRETRVVREEGTRAATDDELVARGLKQAVSHKGRRVLRASSAGSRGR